MDRCWQSLTNVLCVLQAKLGCDPLTLSAAVRSRYKVTTQQIKLDIPHDQVFMNTFAVSETACRCYICVAPVIVQAQMNIDMW